MDSDSRMFPLDLISFYLDISSNEQMVEELTHQHENSSEKANNTAVTLCPAFIEQTADVTAPSPSTEWSISAYIERTVATLVEQVGSSPVTFLPPNPVEYSTSHDVEAFPRFSESGAIFKVVTALDAPTRELADGDEQDNLVKEVCSVIPKTAYFQPDTSDIGDLFDSCGAQMPVYQTTFTVPDSESTTNTEAFTLPESGIEEVTSNNPCPWSPHRQFSASGRSLIRRYFTENTPIKLILWS